jgi:flagellar protein FliJ
VRQFKFKLQAVLKMREFKEDQLKIELGKIVGEINVVKDAITQLNRNIDQAYEILERQRAGKGEANVYQFASHYMNAQRAAIKVKEKQKIVLEEAYKKKIRELETAMGEVKVMESIKDKRSMEYRKKYNKKLEEEIQEVAMMKSHEKDDTQLLS